MDSSTSAIVGVNVLLSDPMVSSSAVPTAGGAQSTSDAQSFPQHGGCSTNLDNNNNITTNTNYSQFGSAGVTNSTDTEVSANVFVASLPNFYDDKMLLELFQPFGAIVSAKVSRDLATGNSRSFGFVRFEQPDAAQRAIADLHGARVKGAGSSKLHVVLSNHNENENAAECDRLYVRNLPLNITSDKLVALFAAYGTVLEANVHGGAQGGQGGSGSRGSANMAVGFVRMSTVDEARRALSGVHNTRPFSPDSPVLVRFMETAEMKAARRSKQRDTEGASGRNSANRNSPDHHGSQHGSSGPASPFGAPIVAPPAYGGQSSSPVPPVPPLPSNLSIPQPQVQTLATFPTFGDLWLQGAASEDIARFVFSHVGYTVSQIAWNGQSMANFAFFVRLADPLTHEKAAAELNNVPLSDGSVLKLVTLQPHGVPVVSSPPNPPIPPQYQQPMAPFQQHLTQYHQPQQAMQPARPVSLGPYQQNMVSSNNILAPSLGMGTSGNMNMNGMGTPMNNVGGPMNGIGAPMPSVGGPMSNVGAPMIGSPMNNVGIPQMANPAMVQNHSPVGGGGGVGMSLVAGNNGNQMMGGMMPMQPMGGGSGGMVGMGPQQQMGMGMVGGVVGPMGGMHMGALNGQQCNNPGSLYSYSSHQ